MGFFRKLIDSEYKELKRFEKMATEVLALDEEMTEWIEEILPYPVGEE